MQTKNKIIIRKNNTEIYHSVMTALRRKNNINRSNSLIQNTKVLNTKAVMVLGVEQKNNNENLLIPVKKSPIKPKILARNRKPIKKKQIV